MVLRDGDRLIENPAQSQVLDFVGHFASHDVG
jgi:hypothetical protein